MDTMKNIRWVGDSLKSLKEFPGEVMDIVGYALHKVQTGEIPKNVKPLKGFKPTVMEIVADYNTNTYRAMYTVKIGELVYVLHCFQKKSKQGIKTPKQEVELIRNRLREAEEIDKIERGK